MNSGLSIKRMSFSKWAKRYRPIKNPFNRSAGVDGYLYHPHGEEWRSVDKNNRNNIWTLVITDSIRSTAWEITNGIHLVNREGFLITERPAEENLSIHVRY